MNKLTPNHPFCMYFFFFHMQLQLLNMCTSGRYFLFIICTLGLCPCVYVCMCVYTCKLTSKTTSKTKGS